MSAAATLADPLAGAYPLLDAARLSELVGAEVCVGGLRHKPGRSSSAGPVGAELTSARGWAGVDEEVAGEGGISTRAPRAW